MQVYKFGGASVKDAQSVRNVFSILEKIFLLLSQQWEKQQMP